MTLDQVKVASFIQFRMEKALEAYVHSTQGHEFIHVTGWAFLGDGTVSFGWEREDDDMTYHEGDQVSEDTFMGIINAYPEDLASDEYMFLFGTDLMA